MFFVDIESPRDPTDLRRNEETYPNNQSPPAHALPISREGKRETAEGMLLISLVLKSTSAYLLMTLISLSFDFDWVIIP
jgi:hypothetical protein